MKNKSLLGLALLASTMTPASGSEIDLAALLERVKVENVKPSSLTKAELEAVLRYYKEQNIEHAFVDETEDELVLINSILQNIIKEERKPQAPSRSVRCMRVMDPHLNGSVRCMAPYAYNGSVRCMAASSETDGSVRCMAAARGKNPNVRCMRTIEDYGSVRCMRLIDENGQVRCMRVIDAEARGTVRCMRIINEWSQRQNENSEEGKKPLEDALERLKPDAKVESKK